MGDGVFEGGVENLERGLWLHWHCLEKIELVSFGGS